MKIGREPIAFNDDDLEGTIQPHDDIVESKEENRAVLTEIELDL